MRDSCKVSSEKIKNNNFDLTPKSINSFFDEIMVYFQKKHGAHKANLFGSVKYMNPKPIIEALTILVTKCNNEFNLVNLPVLTKIFGFLLHPNTPEVVRMPSFQIFLNILSKVNIETYDFLRQAIILLVPYSRFAQGEEIAVFDKEILSLGFPIEIAENKIGDVNDCLNNLKALLDWINGHWPNNPESVCNFLFYYVFSIVYQNISKSSKYPGIPFGFKKPVFLLHLQIVTFFEGVLDSKLDMLPFFSTIEKMSFTLSVLFLNVNPEYKSVDQSVFSVINRILLLSDVCQLMKLTSKDLYVSIADKMCTIIKRYYDERKETQISAAFQDFILAYFNSHLELFGEEDLLSRIELLFDLVSDQPKMSVFIFLQFFHFLISKKILNGNTMKFVSVIVLKYYFLSAAAAKYSQFFALLSFTKVFNVELDEDFMAKCEEYYNNKHRVQISNNFDFVVKEIKFIVDFPQDLVLKKLPCFWGPFLEHESLFEGIDISPIKLKEYSDEEFYQMAEDFLETFMIYMQFDNDDHKELYFGIIIEYYFVLSKLMCYPPNVDINMIDGIPLITKRLFDPILECKNSKISISAFNILISFILHPELSSALDSNILHKWYVCILDNLLSRDQQVITSAKKAYYETFKLQFTGFTSLIPTVLSILEMDIVSLTENDIDFISSIVVYKDGYSLPESIQSELLSRINDNVSRYNEKAVKIIKEKSTETRSRVLKYFQSLCQKSTKGKIDWEQLSRCFIPYLSDELSLSSPSMNNLECIFSVFEPAKLLGSDNGFIIIHSILPYSFLIQKHCPILLESRMQIIINSLTTNANVCSSSNLLSVITSISYILIYNYSIFHKSQIFKDFVLFLSSIMGKPESDFPITIQKLTIPYVKSLLELIGCYFGAYPYVHSVNSPLTMSIPQSTVERNSPYFTRTGSVYQFNTKDQLSIQCQLNAQRSIWKFNPINSQFFQKSSIKGFGISAKNVDPISIKSVASDQQNTFGSSFSKIIDTFADKPNISNELHMSNESYQEFIKTIEVNQIDPNVSTNSPLVFNPKTSFSSNRPALMLSTGAITIESPYYTRELSAETSGSTLEKIYKTNHRYPMRFSVLYSGSKKGDMNSIISSKLNDVSNHYKEFLYALGWNVHLLDHVGYNAELTNRICESSIYYADLMYEVMFKVPVLFKQDELDKNFVNRKKMISTDQVLILWCENQSEFDISTISSPNTRLCIIIYHFRHTGMFRIDSVFNEALQPNGYTKTSVFVRKEVLAPYVRTLAIVSQIRILQNEYITKNSVYQIGQQLKAIIAQDPVNNSDFHTIVSLSSSELIQNTQTENRKSKPKNTEELFFGSK